MNWPPLWICVNILTPGRYHPHHLTFWIPLFIIGPIFLVLLLACFLIALPFALIALLFSWETWWWVWAWRAFPAILGILHSLRGVRVKIDDGRRSQVFITID